MVRFVIADDDSGTHEADDPRDFDAAAALLEKLRAQTPRMQFTLLAEVDA